VLVASDALTRGMDVPGVAAVVNYDAPTFAKTYVHRAGRTARAGQQGARPVRVGGGLTEAAGRSGAAAACVKALHAVFWQREPQIKSNFCMGEDGAQASYTRTSVSGLCPCAHMGHT